MFVIDEFIEAKRIGAPHTGTGTASETTLKAYQKALRRAEKIAKKPLATFSDKDVVVVLNDLHGKAPRTRNRDIIVLRQAFNWAIKTKRIERDNPFEGVRKAKVAEQLPRAIPMDEVQAILDAIGDCAPQKYRQKYVVAFTLQATSGLRIGEIRTLRVKDIVANGLHVTGKGNKQRFVPVREDVLTDLVALSEGKPEDQLVFESRGKRGEQYLPLNISTFTRIFKKAVIQAGMNPDVITPHVLRHSFATHALRSTGRIELVQSMLGHTDPKTTMIYARLSSDDLMQGYEKLWRQG